MSKLVRNSLLPRCVYYLPVYMWLPNGVRKKNSIYRIHINQKNGKHATSWLSKLLH